MDFRLGNGSDLAGVASGSIDAVWSFDVFVHVNRAEFKAYAAEIARVLRQGGEGRDLAWRDWRGNRWMAKRRQRCRCPHHSRGGGAGGP